MIEPALSRVLYPIAAGGLVLLLGLPIGVAAQVDPFYSTRLREGTVAYEREAYRDAARSLRVACFGLLDDGPMLMECLVRLGLAEAKAGDAGAFRETFQRVVEAEELLGLYGKVELSRELRAEFEAEVRSRIPEAVLDASPGFGHLAETEEIALEERRRAPVERPQMARVEEPQEADSRLAEAQRTMREARVKRDLDRAYSLVEEVLDGDPDHREARLLAGEIAYRGSRWELAIEHFQAAGDPGESRCELLFYFAVALYETGRVEEAESTLRRCEGRLGATPFVERYRGLILDGGDGAATG